VVINIRGTSGSGKSYIVRQLLEACGMGVSSYEVKHHGKTLATGVVLPSGVPMFAIGSYVNVCGGCDTITNQDWICSTVRYFSQFGHVVFEGLIVSHLWTRYRELTREINGFGLQYKWLFLDTPLEACIENVLKRREERGTKSEFNTQNTEDKWYAIQKVRQRAIDASFDVEDISYACYEVSDLTSLFDQANDFLTIDQCYRVDKYRPSDANKE